MANLVPHQPPDGHTTHRVMRPDGTQPSRASLINRWSINYSSTTSRLAGLPGSTVIVWSQGE